MALFRASRATRALVRPSSIRRFGVEGLVDAAVGAFTGIRAVWTGCMRLACLVRPSGACFSEWASCMFFCRRLDSGFVVLSNQVLFRGKALESGQTKHSHKGGSKVCRKTDRDADANGDNRSLDGITTETQEAIDTRERSSLTPADSQTPESYHALKNHRWRSFGLSGTW